MDTNTNTYPQKKNENVIAGIVGAFLFSLAGAVVWILLDLIGFYAGISGLVGVVCAIQGYKIFSGSLSKKGIIISAVIALIVLVIASYISLTIAVYKAFGELLDEGEIYSKPSFFECFGIVREALSESSIRGEYFLNLGIGLILAVVGAFSYVRNALKSTGTQPQTGMGGQPPYQGTTYGGGQQYNYVQQNAPYNGGAQPLDTPEQTGETASTADAPGGETPDNGSTEGQNISGN